MAFYLARAQHLPDNFLGFSHLVAQLLGSIVGAVAWVFLHQTSIVGAITPTPPSPIQGEGKILVWVRHPGCAAAPLFRTIRASASESSDHRIVGSETSN